MLTDLLKADRIAFDVHGVIDAYPKFFGAMLNLLRQADREIYIVSGPPQEQIVRELAGLKVYYRYHYNEIHSVVDFLRCEGAKMWQDDQNTWWSSGEDWWGSKGKICEFIKADVMLDDHIEFKAGFPEGHPTKFMLFNYYWTEFFNSQGIK